MNNKCLNCLREIEPEDEFCSKTCEQAYDSWGDDMAERAEVRAIKRAEIEHPLGGANG